jgi:adenylate cyclase, class 2
MAMEIESKFALQTFGPVREGLIRAGARRQSRVFEENLVLDTPDGSLRRRGMLLRLRRDAVGRITLKLPAETSELAGLKVRQEFETEIADLDVLEAILGHLGYCPALRYEKLRETWLVAETHICLDLLPFGRYLEIEGSAASIPEVAASLGLSMGQALCATYHDLYQSHLAACGLPPADSFVFEPTKRRVMLAALADGRDL